MRRPLRATAHWRAVVLHHVSSGHPGCVGAGGAAWIGGRDDPRTAGLRGDGGCRGRDRLWSWGRGGSCLSRGWCAAHGASWCRGRTRVLHLRRCAGNGRDWYRLLTRGRRSLLTRGRCRFWCRFWCGAGRQAWLEPAEWLPVARHARHPAYIARNSRTHENAAIAIDILPTVIGTGRKLSGYRRVAQ